jgi:hypothetical protein
VASDAQGEIRRDALTAYLGVRLREGYLVETRTDTHAIIVRADEPSSFLGRFRQRAPRDRQVIAVDATGEVTTSPAVPVRA